MGQLDGRTALVTGSTSGIGRGIAVALAGAGAHVVVTGRNRDRGEEVAASIRAAGGVANFIAADLASADDAHALATATLEVTGGRLDVLVNNAGIFPGTATLGLEDETFSQVVDTNVRAPFFLTQALLPTMLARGSGVVINVGSWVASVGISAGTLYAASKAMLEALTRGWASEFGSQGIRVNTITPGLVASDPDPDSPANARRHAMAERMPAGRAATIDDIAQAALFLASDASSYLHGTSLVVDGGALATRL
jgi:NAD(P)-dependent dehydrogenase (short-subunit alcohol dehydrogenase family)